MKRVASILALLLAVGFAPALPADSNRVAQAAKKAPKTKPAGKTVYDFSEVDILGRLKRPDIGVTDATPAIKFQRLLDLDESFIPNIVQAVDEF